MSLGEMESTTRGPNVAHVVEHLFRHEAGRMVSTLTSIFGVKHLSLAEDVVQEALARALQTWPYRGVPDNPAAWIMRAARNLAIDHVRRERNFAHKLPEIVRTLDTEPSLTEQTADDELPDDRLRMLFVCCHPGIPAESQIALALKVLGGFSPAEIASAFLTSEAAIAKRLTRARSHLRDAGITFSIPEGPDLEQRLNTVHHSLYLLFNEGYKASSGDQLVRKDVCHEAIRLTRLLVGHPVGSGPDSQALLALMLFNSARLDSRVDNAGDILRLAEQDRSLWDRHQIAQGMFHFLKSAVGERLGRYQLQAAIAAEHCRAGRYKETDWPAILEFYDRLVALDDSPIVRLNRAVVIGEVHGAAAGLESLHQLRKVRSLESYYLFHAVQGEFALRLDRPTEAVQHFERAMTLVELNSERAFLKKRMNACTIGT